MSAVIQETPKNAARRLAVSALRDGYLPEALHEYRDADGSPLYWRIRCRREDGAKWIRPMRFDGTAYVLGEPEKPPEGGPLYRLPELLRTSRKQDAVWIVEGEKAADELARLGVIVTTSGGASSADAVDWSPMRGRRAIIWPDCDDPGAKYADAVADKLGTLDCTVEVIDAAALGLPEKADAVDWLKLHPDTTAADLDALPRVADPVAPNADTVTIERLAALSPMEYDRCRKAEAKTLGVQVGTLDKLVNDARKLIAEPDAGDFEDVTPWPDPVDGAALLSEIDATVRRFIVCQAETAQAVALWVAMTWLMDVVQIAPLAVITAPEKRCGKSQLLHIIGKLSHRPLTASNISPAALFRAVDAWRPTLLIDEVDAFLRESEELRGLLNAGHTRDSAYVVRVVGDDFTPTKFNVWGAKALSGIGHVADTLMDRAVTLELRRKMPHEHVERLRYAEPGLFDTLAAKLARFALDSAETIRRARPDLPAQLNDRAQDNWEPLLAIADVSGGEWPKWARTAALKISGTDVQTESAGTELLADIRDVFEHQRKDRISTHDLIDALTADDELPWATYNRGKPITPRQLAKKLNAYAIRSNTIRIGAYETAKGYTLAQFEDAFDRYLATPSTSVTTSQANNGAASRVTDRKLVTVTESQKVTLEPAPNKACDVVTDTQGGLWEGKL